MLESPWALIGLIIFLFALVVLNCKIQEKKRDKDIEEMKKRKPVTPVLESKSVIDRRL